MTNTHNDMDATDLLLRDLALKETGWSRVEGPNGSAYFPETASDVEKWEADCIAMHSEQTPITVEPKPVQDYADYTRLKRGD